jgi:hypothetical protein
MEDPMPTWYISGFRDISLAYSKLTRSYGGRRCSKKCHGKDGERLTLERQVDLIASKAQ